MRVVTRHQPTDPSRFQSDAHEALLVLARQPGFVSGELGRSPDDPSSLLLTTRWANVGSMRRGMGAFDAKVALAPLMVSAADEPSAFEVLLDVRDGVVTEALSATAPGDAGRPF